MQTSRKVEITWNKDDSEQVSLARKKYEEYIRQGWFAFMVTSDNEKVHIRDFHPDLEKILMIPVIEGG